MLRTNSKKYQENIKNYIISAVNVTDYDTSATTDAEKIAFVMACYESEFNHKYNQVRHPNEQDRFANWLAGLPSVLNIPFSHCNTNEGCVTRISINDEVIKLFKSGKELTLVMAVYGSKDNMSIKLPLKSFSKAYDSLLK